jgi:hypothetical protein
MAVAMGSGGGGRGVATTAPVTTESAAAGAGVGRERGQGEDATGCPLPRTALATPIRRQSKMVIAPVLVQLCFPALLHYVLALD